MSSTYFVNDQTVINADWLNDANSAVYDGNFVSTIITIPTLAATTVRGISVSSSTGTFSSLTAGQLVFAGTGGLLSTSSNLTFNGSTLTAYNLAVTNTLTLASLSLGTPLAVSSGGSGANTLTGYVIGHGTSSMTAVTQIPNSDIGGLGTMSTQNATNVNITGGSIEGVSLTLDSLDNTPVGVNTPASGAFTSLTATSVSGTGFSDYLASLPAIGNTVANSGAFTSLSATTASLTAMYSNNVSIGGGAINATPIGASSATTGKFTTLTATTGIGGGNF